MKAFATLSIAMCFCTFAFGASAQEKQPKGVISIREVVIVGRVQKPVASLDVLKLQPKLALSDLDLGWVSKIEEVVRRDPF